MTEESSGEAAQIVKGLAFTRNEFTHKDNWSNLFEEEKVERFLTADPSISVTVFPPYLD